MRGEERGKKLGAWNKQIEIAKNLLAEGVPLELISKATDLRQEQIKEYVKM